MITLHILQLLEDNGFGTIALEGDETGDNLLYFEKMPLDKYGVSIMSRGTALVRGQRATQSFDLYARGRNDLVGAQKLENILQFFATDCYPVCALPGVPNYDETVYINSTISPTSNIENVGIDDEDRVIYVVSGQVTYQKEN